MLTQDEYKLYTGASVNYSDSDWQKLVAIAASRLADFLCLPALPLDDKDNLPDELKMLLANFVCLMLSERGQNLRVSSKRVRNFTINYGTETAGNAFLKLENTYPDIIANYSECDSALAVEHNTPECSYYGCF